MRTVALFLDFDAILFWYDEQGQEQIDEKTLGISDGLRQQLNRFYFWFSELYLTEEVHSGRDVDNRLFDDRALELWELLRAELAGRYRVIYWSREFSDYFDTPEEFRHMRRHASA
jgi:hypothetical protein